MKAKCTETECEDLVSIRLDIPEQEEIDSGAEPEFSVNAIDMLVCQVPTAGVFYVNAFELLKEDVLDSEDADIAAEWLEHWAKKLREYGQELGLSASPNPLKQGRVQE